MPSEFEKSMAENLPQMYGGAVGNAGIYTSPSGDIQSLGDDGNPLLIRVQRGDARERIEADGEMQSATVLVQRKQIASPQSGGRFTIESVEVWEIQATPTLANGQHICSCARSYRTGMMDRRTSKNA